jgi:hypothetical protein
VPHSTAEKLGFGVALKGHGFSRAVKVFYLCHSEWALAREESAFQGFSAASSAAPHSTAEKLGFGLVLKGHGFSRAAFTPITIRL